MPEGSFGDAVAGVRAAFGLGSPLGALLLYGVIMVAFGFWCSRYPDKSYTMFRTGYFVITFMLLLVGWFDYLYGMIVGLVALVALLHLYTTWQSRGVDD